MMFLVCCILITIRWRLESSTGKTENMGVCTKERKGMTAEVLIATPCTKSPGCESGGHKHGGDEGRIAGSDDDDVEV